MLDKITNIQTLRLNEGEVLVVKIPSGDLPMHAWSRQADAIRTTLCTLLLTNNVVIMQDDISFTVIKKENTKRDYTEHF